MSISAVPFASEGLFRSYDQFAHTERVGVFTLQCRQCGFEPDDTVTPPKHCPKCHARAWERFAKPGSILENAERY